MSSQQAVLTSTAAVAAAAPAAVAASSNLPPANAGPSLAASPSSLPPLKSAIVRSVLSGDTIIIRPKGVNTPGKEETVHIAGIAAPRLGSRDRDDDQQAFPSREYLRTLVVGREIRYRIEYTVPAPAAVPGSTVAQPRQFAHVYLPPKAPGQPDTNVAHEILSAGWAKVHDSVSKRPNASQAEEDEEGSWKQKLRAIQDEASAANVGLWGPDELLKVDHSMPEDTAAFLAQWKGKPVESIVEQVRDGSMLRVRLLLSSNHHQLVNLSLAGIKCPRVAGGGGGSSSDASEPYGEEAKFFVESRLLQRNIKVTLLSVPQPAATPTPFSATASAAPAAAPPTAAVMVGLALHPVGDIAQFLLAAGLGRCVDWHAGMLASYGGMEKYRAAERAAKDKQLNLWKSYNPTPSSATALSAQPIAARTFDAVVCRIISGDTIQVRKVEKGGSLAPEKRVQLSSIRQPPAKDPKQAGYAAEAREFLRKRLIGKTVSVQLDYIKPKEGNFDEREYATIRSGGKEADVGELLISRGLATVMRHKRDDEDRSPLFDKLMEAEAKAVAEAKGLHSGKELPAPRLAEASESVGKANTFLPSMKRAGRLTATVDFVAAASRFKLVVPRENARITFVLAGIRAPRTARNASEKDEPFGREGFEYSTMRVLQRNVEIEVFSTDKAGGFIGAMYLNKTDNFAIELVQHGLASVHGYSAESTPFYQKISDAELQAQAAGKGMWKGFNAEANGGDGGEAGSAYRSASNGALAAGPSAGGKAGWGAAAGSINGASGAGSNEPAPARAEYVDCIISDVRGGSDGGAPEPFGFSLQILGNNQIAELETMMSEFALHHRTPAAQASVGFVPRAGDLVSAKFSQDGQWYRALIKRSLAGAKVADVVFIDYGNKETVSFRDLRPLDAARFGRARLAPQAREARLSFVRLFDGKQQEYVDEAVERFRATAGDGRKLVANIDFVEPASAGGLLHVTLWDATATQQSSEIEAQSINCEMTEAGCALLDEKVRYWKSYPKMTQVLREAIEGARRRREGCFEYGDPTED